MINIKMMRNSNENAPPHPSELGAAIVERHPHTVSDIFSSSDVILITESRDIIRRKCFIG